MKIELKIDGRKVALNQKANIAVTHSIADVQEPDSTSAGYSKSVEVPLIPANMRVFRFTNELYSKEQFNNELHTAEYIVDGNTVMSGVAQIDKITYEFGDGRKLIGGSFHVSVIGASFEWITSAKRQLNELTSTETVTYAMQEVYDNSTLPDASLIKFFPVDRGAFWKEENDTKVPRTHLELKDYHPFFNVWKTLELIFKGYAIRTSMKEQFEKLYCSGSIPEQEDLSYIKEENDFYIGTSVVDVAADLGVIKPNSNEHIIVDIYDKFESDEYHNKNGVIVRIDMRATAAFRPTETATIRLETNLHYVTKIENGVKLYPSGATGSLIIDKPILETPGECFYVDTFKQIIGDNVETIRLTLDKCEKAKDKQGELSYPYILGDGKSDRTCVVYLNFLFEERGTISFKQGGYESQVLGKTKKGGCWYIVNVREAEVHGHFTILFDRGRRIDLSQFNYSYAISDFYYFVIDNNEIQFDLKDCTHNAYRLQKNVTYPIFGIFSCSHSFDSFASERTDGVGLLLCNGNNIKPTFPNIIGLNEPVGISAVGGTSSQLDFIASLRQMFNLMFYTNPLTKEVFIEPRTRFYNLEQAAMVDWRGKIDYSKEIEVEELGGDIGKSLKLAYTDGNEVVEYYNWKRNTELGAYSTPLLNKTADDTKEVVNTMFAPFLLRTVESVGMTLPQEKREKTQDTIDDVDMSITPIIGCFGGVEERTVDDGSGYRKYPQLVFQDASKGVNLGFDDIDRMPTEYGLNQYYKDNISAYNVGRRITVHLRLEPRDVEAIQFPNRQRRDFRAVFLLNFDGEDVPCLLESIEDYNPAGGTSTKCVFISDPNIRLTGDGLTIITYDGTAISRNNTLIGYK